LATTAAYDNYSDSAAYDNYSDSAAYDNYSDSAAYDNYDQDDYKWNHHIWRRNGMLDLTGQQRTKLHIS
jgi:hypothetical protein